MDSSTQQGTRAKLKTKFFGRSKPPHSQTSSLNPSLSPTPIPPVATYTDGQKQITKVDSLPPDSPILQPPATCKSSLWDQAVSKLSPEDQQLFVNKQGKLQTLNDVVRLTKEKRDICINQGFKFEWRGEIINLRDVTDKILVWVDKFKEIGDNLVQIDTAHGALPWFAIRLILQFGLNEKERMGSAMIGIEKATNMISRWTVYEAIYLGRDLENEKSLEKALSETYSLTLAFLVKSYHFFSLNTATRMAKSALLPNPVPDFLDDVKELEVGLTMTAQLLDAEVARSTSNQIDSNYGQLKQILNELEQPIQRIEKTLKTVSDNLDASKRVDILQWISSVRYTEHYDLAYSGLVPGTCQWLLQTDYYKDWQKSSSSRILWLRGDPGVGKTKITALVTKTLGDSAFFFCKRDEPSRRDPLQVLRAIIKQLSIRNGLAALIREYEADVACGNARGPPPTIEKCKSLLLEILDQRPLTYIVVDALDECERNDRQDLLSTFQDLMTESTSLVKIFVSSRGEDDIILALKDVPHHYIEPKDNTKDIESFVSSDLEKCKFSTPGRKVKEPLKDLIKQKMIEGADGMFQWVVLSLEYLRCLRTEQQITKSLGKMPLGLKAAYDQIYELIEKEEGYTKDIATGVLKWVMSANHPMTPEDILSFINLIYNDELDIDTVLGVCHNLIVVDRELNVLRYSHLSVREYLETHFTWKEAHAAIADFCLQVCANTTVSYEVPATANSYKWDMVLYCNLFWMEHARIAGDMDKVRPFLGTHSAPGTGYKHWQSVMKHFRNDKFPIDSHWAPGPCRSLWQFDGNNLIQGSQSPIYLVCYYNMNLPDIWEDYFESEMDPQMLHIATYHRYLKLMKNIVQHDPNVNRITEHYGTALCTAVDKYFREGVEFLLDQGADPNIVVTKFYGTALGAAAAQGAGVSDIRLLLNHGADVNLVSGQYGTALGVAIQFGHHANTETIKFLLEHGADINLVGGKYGSPLGVAASRWIRPNLDKSNYLIDILLENGAEINMTGGKYGSALGVAAYYSNIGAVQSLLSHGADVNLDGGEFGSPYKCIFASGNSPAEKRAVKALFLEAGAIATDTQDEDEDNVAWHAHWLQKNEEAFGKDSRGYRHFLFKLGTAQLETDLDAAKKTFAEILSLARLYEFRHCDVCGHGLFNPYLISDPKITLFYRCLNCLDFDVCHDCFPDVKDNPSDPHGNGEHTVLRLDMDGVTPVQATVDDAASKNALVKVVSENPVAGATCGGGGNNAAGNDETKSSSKS